MPPSPCRHTGVSKFEEKSNFTSVIKSFSFKLTDIFNSNRVSEHKKRHLEGVNDLHKQIYTQ